MFVPRAGAYESAPRRGRTPPLPDKPSPKKTAANTKKTTPMPEESRVKSTMATMRNAIPARTLPSACFDIS